MSAPEKKGPSAGDYRIPASSGWAGAWKIAAGIGVVGLGGAFAGYSMDSKRFAFSYLFAFFVGLTLAFGSMFFVLVERLTAASWSVSVRRTAELFASSVPVFFLLFLPILLMPKMHEALYPWMNGKAEPALESTAHADEPPAAPPGAPPMMHPGGGAHSGARGLPPGMHLTPGKPHAETAEESDAPEEAADARTMAAKSAWLNPTGWMIRALVYLLAWSWIGLTFFNLSVKQDTSKDPKLTVRAQSLAPAATFLFGFTLTGAAFDWLMSMLPTWYSTIYGVTIFAGSVVCMYATLILVTQSLRGDGPLKNAVNVEHDHDLGKLLFGFLVFWAYTSFAQYMLIWYAAIPEETAFYHHRWDMGPWMWVSLAIVVLHFVVPFFILLSRNVKRRAWAVRIGAVWLIAMHIVEMYWQVLPYYGGGESSLHWIDGACLLGIVGTYLGVVFFRMTKYPLIPVGDPRLARSLAFENA